MPATPPLGGLHVLSPPEPRRSLAGSSRRSPPPWPPQQRRTWASGLGPCGHGPPKPPTLRRTPSPPAASTLAVHSHRPRSRNNTVLGCSPQPHQPFDADDSTMSSKPQTRAAASASGRTRAWPSRPAAVKQPSSVPRSGHLVGLLWMDEIRIRDHKRNAYSLKRP